jgi:hypothetical protein
MEQATTVHVEMDYREWTRRTGVTEETRVTDEPVATLRGQESRGVSLGCITRHRVGER